ncbi:PLC-like phosphodiesterase [Xylaria bambusicola]|uniref:PLC-like phosphodiesterase n=1 Tax=Xylaria bambusicola TaxID=326684 RepID=UPI002008C3C3|nr:PLC-like phosphodiesterase [Xylaria bambusicola]KAI0512786.1 PLC-like phosphodiesterase [Xylaria bambusicola]
MRLPRSSTSVLLAASCLVDVVASTGSTALGQLALDKLLQDARDVFGSSSNLSLKKLNYGHGHGYAYNKYARWMAGIPDDTPLTQLTIPGTHDAATWNYTQGVQDALVSSTRDCESFVAPRAARAYRCQTQSILASLESGIRFFDLRFALDGADSKLVFWHGPALLSARAGVDDVLFGFYSWLDDHPGEFVLLSFQYEAGTRVNATSDERVQRLMFEALTDEGAERYVDRRRGALGTLGEVRGKIVLFRRFDLDKLPPEYEAAMPGLHMSPGKWTDNSRGFELVYNETTTSTTDTGTAFIEDFYHPDNATSIAENIDAKFDAVDKHLRQAAAREQGRDSLFVTFTSGTHVEVDPPVYPETMALGLKTLLRELKEERLGVVVMDFFEDPEGLIDLLLDF